MKGKMALLYFFVLFMNSMPMLDAEARDYNSTSTITIDGRESTSSSFADYETEKTKDIKSESGLDPEAMKWVRQFQMAWPAIKALQNAVEGYYVDRNPECLTSQVLSYIGITSLASLMTRLVNFFINMKRVQDLLDEMEDLVIGPDDVPRETIDTAAFYTIMVKEHTEYARSAFADFLADTFDLAASSVEMVIIAVETFNPTAADCVPMITTE